MWPTCNKTFPVAARYPKYIANSSVTRKLYRRTRSRKSARASSNNTCQRLALTALIARPPPRPRAAVKCNSNTRPPATAPPTQRRDPAAAPPLLEPARHLRAARFRKFETVAEWPAIQRSESPIPTPGLPRRAAISPARHAPAGVLRPKSRYPSRSLPRRKQCASKESQCARRKVPKANCEIARALPDPIPLLARPQSAAPDRSAALAQFPRAVSCRRKIRPAHGHAPRPDSPRPAIRQSVAAPTPHPILSQRPDIPGIPTPSDADTHRNPAANIPARCATDQAFARCPRHSTTHVLQSRASP